MDFSPSTSMQTIRINTHPNYHEISTPSSPRSAAFPTPPDSPSDSLSSFPSVSSSFFFSSSAASPHMHPQPPSDHASAVAEGLIIPSLTLPTALQQPTPYGQTIGDVRLLLMGSKQSGKIALANYLVDGNVDVVDVDPWEREPDAECGEDGAMLLRASTDWLEERDMHGLERFEPSRNLRILKLPGFDPTDSWLQTNSHIFMPSAPTSWELEILAALAPYIPVICIPPCLSSARSFNSPIPLSSFRPPSAFGLRTGLFRNPQTLATLRSEAADRFLRWREVERAVSDVHKRSWTHDSCDATAAEDFKGGADPKENSNELRIGFGTEQWSKAEWEASLSEDLARALRGPVITAQTRKDRRASFESSSCHSALLDPLYIPSLFMLSLSLLTPLKTNLLRVVGGPTATWVRDRCSPRDGADVNGRSTSSWKWTVGRWRLGITLVGVFCAGVGIGVALST